MPLFALATACGVGANAGPGSSPSPGVSTPIPIFSPSISHSAAPTPKVVLTATEVIKDLAKRIPSIKLTVVYNASTDPNHLLGRPGQYTSKAAFTDSRLTASETEGIDDLGDVQLGGGVEVYPTAAGAQQRARYLYTLSMADPMLGVEYDFLAGPILLRVSGLLTPAQADVDKRALAAITGVPVKTES